MQYKTQYGTIFAVKEHNGAPAIMCRAEHSETWSLSSMIAPYTPGAWTAEELQSYLDNWAATKGWQPVEEPAGSETRGIVDDEDAEIRATDSCKCESCFAHGCAKECPVNAEESCLTIGCPEYVGGNEPCKTETPAPTGDAAATTDGSAAVSTAETTTTSESGVGANSCGTPAPTAQPSNEPPAELAPTAPSSLPAFDYSGLDADTAEHLQNLAQRATEAKQRYILDMMEIVVEAHRELCDTVVQPLDNGRFSTKENTFTAWCASIGVGRSTAYNLLQVQALMDGSTPEEQEVLADAPAKLLYAAAKPSAPPELVQAVKDRDITTAKEFRELEAQLKAERAAREKAEQECEEAVTHIKIARELQIDTARERDTALRRAAEAENRAAGAQKLAEQRGNENTELKARIRDMENQPRDVAVVQPGEAQIEAWRKEGEARAAAALRDSIRKADQDKADAQRQVNALQDQLAAAVPDADACQRTADTLYETTENLRLLLRTQLRQAQLPPADYGSVVAHVLQAADALRDTVRSCAPAGYTMDEEDDFL